MIDGTTYSDEEWGLLVGLPQSVAIAAAAAEPDSARRTQAEREMGQQAIAEGRADASPLVVRVAEELLSRVGDPEEGEAPPDIELPDREAGIADVLQRARTATALLAERADEGDAGAYRFWLVTIAQAVVGSARSGGVLGVGGEWISESERRFVDELSSILRD